MSVTLKLKPEIETRLRAEAMQAGLSLEDYLSKRIEQTPEPDLENRAVIRLLRQWRAEDAAMTPEEEEEADYTCSLSNILANRRRYVLTTGSSGTNSDNMETNA